MSAAKKAPKLAPKAAPVTETVLVLRTCAAGRVAHGGFVWPESGLVEAPDWSPAAACGHGLHGLLWGAGDGALLDWTPEAVWMVVEVNAASVVDLGGKVKFPRGMVVYCGDRKTATDLIAAKAPRGSVGVGGTSTSGDYGTSTSGDDGTSTSGDYGTSTSGDYGTLVIKWFDGSRYRLAVGYVGEGGIKPDTPYKVDGRGQFVEVAS